MLLSSFISSMALGSDYKLTIDGRFDFIRAQNYATGSEKTENVAFQTISPRVMIDYKVSDKTSFVARYNFTQGSGPTSSTFSSNNDLITSNVEYFYVSHQMAKNLEFKIGKIFFNSGSAEFDYDEQDIYLYSNVSGDLAVAYHSGAHLGYLIGNHEIAVQVGNSTGNTSSQEGGDLVKTLAFYGSFMDGKIRPILTTGWYPREPSANSLGTSETERTVDTYSSLGLIYNANNLNAEIEYTVSNKEEYKSYDSSDSLLTTPETSWQSIIGKVKYTHGSYSPFVKIQSEKYLVDGNDSITSTTPILGVEYNADEVRYHLVYSNRQNDLTNSNTSGTEVLNVGVRVKIE